jgi:hypothetical protein
VNYACSAYFGIKPATTNFWLKVPQNNTGYQANVLLASHAGNGQQWDNFTVTVRYL